jgi:hypothetical protein
MKALSPWLFAVVVLMCALGVCGETSGRDGWYTSQQAAAGAQAYKKTCAGCHGATLEGGMGPALVGTPFKSLNSVVECTHPDSDDGTELDAGEKLRQHYGLSVAEKRRTRRRQAT